MRRKVLVGILALFLLLLAGCSQEQGAQYVGSINSDKYHYPDCKWAERIKPENEIWFDSIKEAEEAGYKPCKACRP